MSEKKYLKFIAYLQIIGIFLVVFGHSFHEYPDSDYGRGLLVYRMMHSFRMPLFMFVSGFLMFYTTEAAVAERRAGFYGRFVRGKLRRLLLPFAVLTLVTFVPRALFSPIADEAVPLTAEAFVKAFVYPRHMVIPYLWFLQASFTLLVVCITVLVMASRLKIPAAAVDTFLVGGAVCLFAGPALPQLFSLHSAGKLAIYFVLGIVYARNIERVDIRVCWTSPLLALVLWALWAALFFAFGNKPVYMPLCSVAGIAACISVVKILDARDIRILDPFFGANYMIFLLSWYFNILSQQVLAHFVELPWPIHTALSLVTGIFIPWLIYRFMQSHSRALPVRVAAFLLGQSLRRKRDGHPVRRG